MNAENSNCSVLKGVTWTVNATSLLLNLYESELQSLESTKKKKKIWQAITRKLKNHNIEVTADQVRWKINALTKKYKRCIENGSSSKFKHFQVMEQIYAKHNVIGRTYTISELLDSKTDIPIYPPFPPSTSMKTERKAIIELRKMRLANRLESDRAQTKIKMERQWLEYLNRQEQSRQEKDMIIERHIRIKEQVLELKKRELELRQSIALKNIQLIEKDVTEILEVEKEKCDVLKLLT